MKKYLICLSALSLTACVGGTPKSGEGSADTSNAPPVFSPVGETTAEGNSTTPGSSFLGGGTPSGGGGTDGDGSGGGGTGGGGGGGTGGGGTTVNFSNDSSLISELDDFDKGELCQEATGALENALGGRDAAEVFCEAASVGAAAEEGGDSALCREYLEDCLSQISTEDITCFNDEDSSCNATVGQFEACVNSSVPLLAELASFTCDDISNPPPSDFFDVLESPECEEFEDACDGPNEFSNNADPDPDVVTPDDFNNF